MGLPRGSFAGRGPPSSPMSLWISPPPAVFVRGLQISLLGLSIALTSSGVHKSPPCLLGFLPRCLVVRGSQVSLLGLSIAVLSSGVHRSPPCYLESPPLSCCQESTYLLHVSSSLPRSLVVRSPQISFMSPRVSPSVLSSGVHRSLPCHLESPLILVLQQTHRSSPCLLGSSHRSLVVQGYSDLLHVREVRPFALLQSGVQIPVPCLLGSLPSRG